MNMYYSIFFKIFFNLKYIEKNESLEEENQQVHNTNNATIVRLQELETTSSQLQVNLFIKF